MGPVHVKALALIEGVSGLQGLIGGFGLIVIFKANKGEGGVGVVIKFGHD